MNKKTYTERAREHVAETKEALTLVYSELNQGQQKKILKNEQVKAILVKYGVVAGEAKASEQSETDYSIPHISEK